MSQKECALNPTNLALIGALDDFYEAYRAVFDIYDPLMTEAEERIKTSNWIPNTGDIDKLARKEVKEICDPLLDKYKMIFTDDPRRLYLKVTQFSMEDFIPKRPLKLELRIKSFSNFLGQLQRAVTSTLYGRRLVTKPKYLLEPFTKEVDDHIEKYITDHDINQPDANLMEDEHEPTPGPLFVYHRLSSVVCHRERHSVVPEIYYGRLLSDGKVVKLPAHYCEQCEKYFMGAITYDMYEKIHGIIIVEKYRFNESGVNFDELCNESRLHRLGYNVINGKLSETERRSILVTLIKFDVMTYKDIDTTIDDNIIRFRNNSSFGPAVSKWKSDRKYIGDLVCSGDISKKQIRGDLNNGVE